MLDENKLSIEKKININKLPCYVQEKDFYEIVSYPFTYKLGVVFAYDLLLETDGEMVFESQAFESY